MEKNYNIPPLGAGSVLFTQSGLLVINYAFHELPWWVTWFPALVMGSILSIIVLVIIGAVIASATSR